MKFENSLYEERYNEYWNNNVVILDKTICGVSLGFKFFDDTNVAKLIDQYQQHVLNILVNLDRQAHLFEDKAYVQKYKENTIEQAIEDLSFYEKMFPEDTDISSEFLEAIGKKSPVETKENSYNNNV